MTSPDWFIGSASRTIDPNPSERTTAPFAHCTSPLAVHAIGFRGEDCLFALVVCDIAQTQLIDRSSLRFHIHLHPITPVEVVIVASGTTASPAYGATSAAYQHRVVHAITDCVIDALTFGCPAVMRVTPDAIQWRKHDEHPIATLTFHAAGTQLRASERSALHAACHEPVLAVTDAHRTAPVPVATIIHDIRCAPRTTVGAVQWRTDETGWALTVETTTIHIRPRLAPGENALHTIAVDPQGAEV